MIFPNISDLGTYSVSGKVSMTRVMLRYMSMTHSMTRELLGAGSAGKDQVLDGESGSLRSERALPSSGLLKSGRHASSSQLVKIGSQRSLTNYGETDTEALQPSGLMKSGCNASFRV